MDGNDDIDSEEWGPFGRPIFSDPSARALARVGVVDVGSNSVRMVVFDGAARSPAYFYNEKIMCALGEGMVETGHLNPTGRARALSAIARFQGLATGMGIAPLTAVATAAVRSASDGADFCHEVEVETGLKIHVIDGKEEARLSAQGVLLGWPDAEGVVCDIGGASMELAELQDGDVKRRMTSALGPLALQAVPGGRKGRKAVIKETLSDMAENLDIRDNKLFLVGGSWRAFARLDMERRNYPLNVLHEYRMTPRDVRATADMIRSSDISELNADLSMSAARMALVPIASEVLREILKIMKPSEIAVSAYGIREGMLYEQMPTKIRKRDPLIEACRYAEAKDARINGFGKVLFDFVEPLLKTMPKARRRLVRAACHLHDVSWRAHPDYRAEVCFENATRANLGGLTHSERVFLGLALLHRYKNSRENSPFEDLFTLLSEKEIAQAEVIGKAMRLGSMFSVQNKDMMGRLKFFPKKKVLEMELPNRTAPLYGEVAVARFKSLARTLNAEPNVKILKPGAWR